MGRKKPLVIVTRKLPGVVETRMCELFDDAAQHRRQANAAQRPRRSLARRRGASFPP